MFANIGCDATHKLLTGCLLGHTSYVARSQLHGMAPIAAEPAMLVLALRGGTVNDSHEVSGDDDSVLAFLLWVLGDERLFYDLHGLDMLNGVSGLDGSPVAFYTRRNTGVGLVSLLVSWRRRQAPAYMDDNRYTRSLC